MGSLGGLGIALIVIAGLLFARSLLARHGMVKREWWTGRPSATRQMQVIERLPLTAQHGLHLVRIADRGLLVAVHTNGCNLLDAFPWPVEPDDSRVETRQQKTI